MNIGDRFMINYDRIYKVYPNILKCKYQNITFIIENFSKSKISVYYKDNRTNLKCLCYLCKRKSMVVDGVDEIKSISTYSITIVETKLQRERNLKLKSLNI